MQGPCSIHRKPSGGKEMNQLAIYTYICTSDDVSFIVTLQSRCCGGFVLRAYLSRSGSISLSGYDVQGSTTYKRLRNLDTTEVRSYYAIKRYKAPELLLLFYLLGYTY